MTDRYERLMLGPSCDNAEALQGSGPVKYCGICDHAVIDLTDLTTSERRAVQSVYAGRQLCVRIMGEMPRPKPVRRVGFVLALGLSISGLALAGCGPAEPGVSVPSEAPEQLRGAVRAAQRDAQLMNTPISPHPRQVVPRLDGPMPVVLPMTAAEEAARHAGIERQDLRDRSAPRNKTFVGMMIGGPVEF